MYKVVSSDDEKMIICDLTSGIEYMVRKLRNRTRVFFSDTTPQDLILASINGTIEGDDVYPINDDYDERAIVTVSGTPEEFDEVSIMEAIERDNGYRADEEDDVDMKQKV
jgi:hypothetical protein